MWLMDYALSRTCTAAGLEAAAQGDEQVHLRRDTCPHPLLSLQPRRHTVCLCCVVRLEQRVQRVQPTGKVWVLPTVVRMH